MPWYVYLLKCVDGTLYCGVTTDPARRLAQHNGAAPGGARYTRTRRPVRLAALASFPDRSAACKAEWRIKRMNRTEKEGLIREWGGEGGGKGSFSNNALPHHSSRKNSISHEADLPGAEGDEPASLVPPTSPSPQKYPTQDPLHVPGSETSSSLMGEDIARPLVSEDPSALHPGSPPPFSSLSPPPLPILTSSVGGGAGAGELGPSPSRRRQTRGSGGGLPPRPPEALVFSRPDGVSWVRVVRARGMKHAFERHAHEGFVFGRVDVGERLTDYGAGEVCCPAGALFVVGAGRAHACRPGGGGAVDYRALVVDAERVRGLAAEMAGGSAEPEFGEAPCLDGVVLGAFEAAFGAVAGRTAGMEREEAVLGFLAAALERLARIVPGEGRCGHEAVARAKEYLREHAGRHVELAELAGAACASPYHLHRTFAAETGATPHEWLMDQRVRRARRLLEEGVGAAEAALAAGFVDQSHFTRWFRRIVGLTPGKYVKGLGKR